MAEKAKQARCHAQHMKGKLLCIIMQASTFLPGPQFSFVG